MSNKPTKLKAFKTDIGLTLIVPQDVDQYFHVIGNKKQPAEDLDHCYTNRPANSREAWCSCSRFRLRWEKISEDVSGA